MYKLCFYVPVAAAELVKEAVFSSGAGCIGNYEACCWEVEGWGQFRPLKGANPAMGKVNQLERVRELKIELVCEAAQLSPAIAALLDAHPYEEPAYQYWQVESVTDVGVEVDD